MCMLAYKALEDSYNMNKKEEEDSKMKLNSKHYNHTLIERCVSSFRKRRCHCNIMNFDRKYLNGMMMKGIILKMCKPEIKRSEEKLKGKKTASLKMKKSERRKIARA